MLPFEDFWRSEILVLMNGPSSGSDAMTYHRNLDPDGEAALLQMRTHQMREDEWAAINDLLSAIDPNVAAQKMLEDIRVTQHAVHG